MGMKQTIEVLNDMVKTGTLSSYAIGGAVAAFNYVEASTTDDLDVLVSFEAAALPSGLVTLGPITTYLRERGYTKYVAEGIEVEGWPVQFLPVADELDAEALQDAIHIEIEINPQDGKVPTRILSAEHVIAKALSVGRPKDNNRILQFIESGAFDAVTLSDTLDRHDLRTKWEDFCKRFEVDDPCSVRTPT